MTLEEVRSSGEESKNKKMDTLLSSCPFFWASCMPWWNGIIVENAADNMFELLSEVEGCHDKILAKAEGLRDNIYGEVSIFNKTGKAANLQNEFLTKNKINRRDVYQLIHLIKQ